MQPYTTQFFSSQQNASLESAQVVAPIVMDLVRPASVIDIGAGNGTWASAFRAKGVTDVRAVDGSYVDPEMLLVPRECFQPHDLNKPYKTDRKYDMAISLEVAEHLPAECADTFVSSLTALAPVVLFSAAVPWPPRLFE